MKSFNRGERWSFIGLANAGVFNAILMGGNVAQKDWGLVAVNFVGTFGAIMALTYFLLKED